MKLRVLGCDGGRGLGYTTTSLLFNRQVMIDAGTIQTALTLEESLDVTDIFLTHSHLDHLIDLPFLLDATFSKRTQPLRIHGTSETLDSMMKYIFNDKIWPNFSKLPRVGEGQFTLHEIEAGKTYEAQGLKFTPFYVSHSIETVGYKIEDEKGSSLVFSGDTGPEDSIWKYANACDNLKAVIVDLSFPVSEQEVAGLSGHMTANDVASELQKLKKDCDVYAFHFKVGMAEALLDEMKALSHEGRPLQALRHFKELEF